MNTNIIAVARFTNPLEQIGPKVVARPTIIRTLNYLMESSEITGVK